MVQIWLRRIFWPNEVDADWSAAFGAWVVLAVGVYLGTRALLWGQVFLGLVDLVLYTIGAAGIRMRSRWAAGLGWAWIALGLVGNLLTGLTPFNPEAGGLVLMTGSVRASWLPKEALADAAFGDWFRRAFLKVWRVGRVPFLVIATAAVALVLWGTVQALNDGGLKNSYSIEQDGAVPKR